MSSGGANPSECPPDDKGKHVASTTTSGTCKVAKVVSCSPLDQSIPMSTTAHTQTPSPHTYTLPPPTHTQTPSIHASSAVYPQHAFARPIYRPPPYAQPTLTLPGCAQPSYPPTCSLTPSTYTASAGYPHNAYAQQTYRPFPYAPPRYPQHEYAPLVYTPSTYTRPTFTPLTYAPPSTYTGPTFTPPTYAPPSTYTRPAFTRPTFIRPTFTRPTYTPPTYPLSGGPSQKVPQFIPMPEPQIQGTQGTSLMSGHPKLSQPELPELEPFQADKDGIHDAEHLIDSEVEKDSDEVEVCGDGQHIIQSSTKVFLPSKSAAKSIPAVIQSQNEKMRTKYWELNDDDRANFIKALSENYVWNDQHNDQVESNFLSAVSHYLSDMLSEVRLKGQRPHWISETIWQCLLEHWSSADFQLTYAKEMENMTSEEDESLHTDSISTSEDAAQMEMFEAMMFQTRSQCNSTSPSMSCNLAKNAVASLSASGIDGGKKKRSLNNVGTLATNSKEGAKAKRLNSSLDNTRTPAASNARQVKPDMVEVLHSLATSSAETSRTLKEMMKSQQELLRIIQEEHTRAHAQKHERHRSPKPSNDSTSRRSRC